MCKSLWDFFHEVLFLGEAVAAPRGGLGENCPPKSQKSVKLSKKNGIKFGGYTLSLKNNVEIPPPATSFGFFKASAAT